jgi:hypothetical protein
MKTIHLKRGSVKLGFIMMIVISCLDKLPAQMRVWTNGTTNNNFSAALIGKSDDNSRIRIIYKTGAIKTLSTENLSKADNIYVGNWNPKDFQLIHEDRAVLAVYKRGYVIGKRVPMTADEYALALQRHALEVDTWKAKLASLHAELKNVGRGGSGPFSPEMERLAINGQITNLRANPPRVPQRTSGVKDVLFVIWSGYWSKRPNENNMVSLKLLPTSLKFRTKDYGRLLAFVASK